MSAIHITFACGLYDRMLPLYTGDVKATASTSISSPSIIRAVDRRMNSFESRPPEM